MNFLFLLILFTSSALAKDPFSVRGTKLSMSNFLYHERYEKRFGELFSAHFQQIKEYEQKNNVVCIAVQLVYNVALGSNNIFQMQFHCRGLDSNQKVTAVYSTYTQIENTYFKLYPPLSDYSFDLKQHNTSLSH